MQNPPLDRNKLARRLERGVDAVKAAQRRAKELPEPDASQIQRDATHALVTIATAVADELDTTLGKVDL